MAPEALFDPGLIKEGDEALGIHDMSFASIQDCDVDIRMDLYGNIILSGGTTLYAGLPDRLEAEVDKKCPQQGSVKIIASQDRYYSVWTGGSTLSSLSTFESQWITKEEYEENGTEIVHRKCVWATFRWFRLVYLFNILSFASGLTKDKFEYEAIK